MFFGLDFFIFVGKGENIFFWFNFEFKDKNLDLLGSFNSLLLILILWL